MVEERTFSVAREITTYKSPLAKSIDFALASITSQDPARGPPRNLLLATTYY